VAELICQDDDPTCDFGASTGDAACTFHVASCVNVNERRFRDRSGQPTCSPTDVAWVVMLVPREANPHDEIDRLNRDALEAALAGAGATLRRQCQALGVEPSTPCASDADCGRTKRCRTRFMLFDPPSMTIDQCTSFAEIVVPLRQGRSGPSAATRTLRLTATSSTRVGDTDVLKLVCRP
jgi:hypothetical protein